MNALAVTTVFGLAITAAPVAFSTPSTSSPAIAGQSVLAQAEPGQVVDFTVTQQDGYATLAWSPVPGATDYQVERTPTSADGTPTGAAQIVGLWRPNRQINQEEPTFADAGFGPGDSFQWRVRARMGTTAQPWSAPVTGVTLPPWGNPDVPGENLRTQWEQTRGVQYTSDVNEYAYTAELDRLSDRVRVVEIGRSFNDRPINLFVIGDPPPADPESIARTNPALINCNGHGNEPGAREACFILARQLAFGDDERTTSLLADTTVLIVPTINADGRANNTRGNPSGQDLNRDYSLIRQPETFSFVAALSAYRPVASFDGHEYGNSATGDLPMLPPRHLNASQAIFDESLRMIEGHMYGEASLDGWWPCPYGCQNGGGVGLSQETILRNTAGLKNVVTSLLELRSSGGQTRPGEPGNTSANRQRKTYSGLWTFNEFLDYHNANMGAIVGARTEAIPEQISNTGPVVFRGSRTIPAYPAPHPGEAPPPEEPASPVLDIAPCAYRLTEEQYNGARTDGPTGRTTTVAQRLAAHGWKVAATGDGYVVPMNQPERGLIPLLLDELAVEGMTVGERIYPNLTGTRNGPLDVTGVTCADGATLRGPVNVSDGGVLIAVRSTLTGPVTASNAGGVYLADNSISGPVRISDTDSVLIASNTGKGPVELTGSGGGAAFILNNTMRGPLRCSGNATVPTDLNIGNSFSGPASGQCEGL